MITRRGALGGLGAILVPGRKRKGKPVGWSSQAVIATQVIVQGANDGIFVYNGTAAAGTLIYTEATVNGADPYGNAVFAGTTSYTKLDGSGPWVAINTFSGEIFSYTSSSPTAPPASWTPQVGLGFSSTGFGLSVTGPYVDINAPILGTLKAVEPGTTYTAETWNTMTLLNGWSVGAGGIAEYKLMPDNTVMIRATHLSAGTITGGTSIWTPPSGYIPAQVQRMPLIIENSTGTAAADSPRVDVSPTDLEVWNIPSPTTFAAFTARYALD